MARNLYSTPYFAAPRLAHIRHRARIMALMGGAVALGLLPNELLLGKGADSPLLVAFRLGIAASLFFGGFAISRSPQTRFHVLTGTLGVFLLFLAGFFLFPLGLFEKLPPTMATAYAMTPVAILAIAGIFPFLVTEGVLLIGVVVGFLVSAVAGQILPASFALAQAGWATALLAAVVLWMQKMTLRSLEHADFLGRTDPLTGTYNRRGLEEAGAQLAMTARRFAVLLVDIDRFKALNDSRGHGSGDDVLKTLAQALMRTSRGEDTVGRLGGDEFVILTLHDRAEDARALGERIREVLRRFLPDPEEEVGSVTVSVGIAVRRDGEDFEAVSRRADEALYRAKETGGDRVAVAEEGKEAGIRDMPLGTQALLG